MDNLHSDLVLGVFSFLSAHDNARVVRCCRRFLYLVERFRAEPELVAAASSGRKTENGNIKQGTPREVFLDGLSRLRSPPNVAFCFYSDPRQRASFCHQVDRLLPHTTVVGVQSHDTQSYCGDDNTNNSEVESTSNFSCLLGSFPRAKFQPFFVPAISSADSGCPMAAMAQDAGKDDHSNDSVYDLHLKDMLSESRPVDEDEGEDYWKVFVVYVCGSGADGTAEDFLQQLQRAHPHATIVGGVCDKGDVRLPDTARQQSRLKLEFQKKSVRQLKRLIVTEWGHDALSELRATEKSTLVDYAVENMLNNSTATVDGSRVGKSVPTSMTKVTNGVYGVAIGGDAPVRSVVSRGLKSLSGNKSRESSPWRVQDVDYVEPGEDDYPYSGQPHLLRPIHIIRSFANINTGQKNVPPGEFLRRAHNAGSRMPQFLGVAPPDDDAADYVLHSFSVRSNLHHGALYLMSDGPAADQQGDGDDNVRNAVQRDCAMELFELDGEACAEDLDDTLVRLRDALHADGTRRLLGALLFTCSGRGPDGGPLLRDDMADARGFQRRFPALPCVGFYANGEIGPPATHGQRGDLYRRGRVALQGFTAVFAVFEVPAPRPRGTHDSDDHAEVVNRYLEARFGTSGVGVGNSSSSSSSVATTTKRRGKRDKL